MTQKTKKTNLLLKLIWSLYNNTVGFTESFLSFRGIDMKKNNHRNENAKRILKGAGYSKGGSEQNDSADDYDNADDKALVSKYNKMTNKPTKTGYVNDGAPKKRLDKVTRKAAPVQMARGGAAKKKGSKTQVNVIITGKDKSTPVPVPVPAPAAAHPMPAAPMPAPGGMPPRPGMKKGGAVKMSAGAGGGLGRLEKAKEYGGKPLNRGGKCKK